MEKEKKVNYAWLEGDCVKIVTIVHKVVENESGLVEFYQDLSAFEKNFLRWTQGFVVAKGRIYSVIYGNPIQMSIRAREDGLVWDNIIFPMEDSGYFPKKHSELKGMAGKHYGWDISNKELGGGFLVFTYTDNELFIEVGGFSGDYGCEEDRTKTLELLRTLFPKARVIESEESFVRRKQLGK